MTPFEEEIERTVEALKAGKTILYPTDTIWGIGCDATNSKACDKVYEAKKRPASKSLIDIAITAGCDAVKFQKRTIDIVYTKEELAKEKEGSIRPEPHCTF